MKCTLVKTSPTRNAFCAHPIDAFPDPRILCLIFATVLANVANAQLALDLPPINYSTTEPSNPVAILQSQVESGMLPLNKDVKFGYLAVILEKLKIPVSSQTLVFSKTSFQRQHISPSSPRAIYFNDESYVGWVPGGDLIEIATTDPQLGTVFYTIDQRSPAMFQRNTERCLFCHASSDTGRIPGLLMQSVFSDKEGNRTFPINSMWPKSDGPLDGRWAGWFVTGTHGKQHHLGNLMVTSHDSIARGTVTTNGNVADLSKWFDASQYLSPHSDIVALLVLQHQVTIHNLLTDTNHRARRQLYQAAQLKATSGGDENEITEEDNAVFDQLAERLVDGLLMVGETEFVDPVSGTSRFAVEFSQSGPCDSHGRTLHALDLKHSLFLFPCSYLIYSDSFDDIPKPVLDRVYRRITDVLGSTDVREKYRHMTSDKRELILQILRETKQGFQ